MTGSTQTTSPQRHGPDRAATRAWTAARVMLVLSGLFGFYAVFYFGFLAGPADAIDTVGDVLVAAWKVLLSLAFLWSALSTRTPLRTRQSAVLGLVVVDAAFSVVKLLGYDEAEATLFLAVDVVLVVLVLLSRRSFTDGRPGPR